MISTPKQFNNKNHKNHQFLTPFKDLNPRSSSLLTRLKSQSARLLLLQGLSPSLTSFQECSVEALHFDIQAMIFSNCINNYKLYLNYYYVIKLNIYCVIHFLLVVYLLVIMSLSESLWVSSHRFSIQSSCESDRVSYSQRWFVCFFMTRIYYLLRSESCFAYLYILSFSKWSSLFNYTFSFNI